jgi:hypothetical protein
MARIAFLLLALFAEMERTFTAEPPPTPARSLNPRAATSADPPPDPTTRSTTPDCFVNGKTASAKSGTRPASRRHHCTTTSRQRPNKNSDRGVYPAEQGFMYRVRRR